MILKPQDLDEPAARSGPAKKKQRDRGQALTVAWIVSRHLPQYKFSSSELKMFPKAIIDNARRDIDALTLPDDFG